MRWMVRLPLVASIAAAMAVVGFQLMFNKPAEWLHLEGQSFCLIYPSVLLWLMLASVVVRNSSRAGC